jgi:hypothetical protein
LKNIHTLIPDIYELLGSKNGITTLPPDLGSNVHDAVEKSFGVHDSRGLRLSGLGPKCPRALWYSIHHPELAEPIPPHARIKFAYGHVIEHLVIALAKAAGHEVTGEQDEIIVDGILGHRDCVIDGCVVDVKSAASRSFLKFRDKTLAEDDPFGYLDQIDGYVLGSVDDPLVRVKDRGYLLAVEKQLGHLALYEHRCRNDHIKERIRLYKEIVGRPQAPACNCGTVADGKSGNIKLDTRASYSSFKHCCFPNLRTFLYSSGPVYLTKVARVPDVLELTSKYKSDIIHG